MEEAGDGADLEGSFYQSRGDCTRSQAMIGVGTGGVVPSA